ncbi:MAG: hypothetical protein U0U25_14650 [Flavobacteriales bacterium]
MTQMSQMNFLSVATICSFISCTGARPVYEGKPNNEPGVLHLHATYTEAYCGGADPGPDGMPRPQPWRGPMYLRVATPDSNSNMALNDLQLPIVDTIRTDATGNGTLTLPAGQYLLLDQEHVDDTRYRQLMELHDRPALGQQMIDTACLKRWLRGPFGVVTIRGGDTTRVELPLFGHCPWHATPCLPYLGPYPP